MNCCDSFFRNCIECLGFASGPFKKNCSEACESISHEMAEQFTKTSKQCQQKDSGGCWIKYKLDQLVGKDNYSAEILTQRGKLLIENTDNNFRAILFNNYFVISLLVDILFWVMVKYTRQWVLFQLPHPVPCYVNPMWLFLACLNLLLQGRKRVTVVHGLKWVLIGSLIFNHGCVLGKKCNTWIIVQYHFTFKRQVSQHPDPLRL